MKKSQYLEKRKKFWEQEQVSIFLGAHIEQDLMAAVAAEVTWDPEEPELTGWVEASRHRGDWTILAGKSPEPPRFLRETEAREAARRYNLWQPLEARMADLEKRGYTGVLLEIRDIMQVGTPGSDEEGVR